jgi:helix-turn-helix protein
MGRRHPNPKLVKIHRNYTVEEAARKLGVHKNSVRAWIKSGLPVMNERRPTLIYGLDLLRFLQTRRKSARRPCPPGHMYCLRCRVPQRPAGDMADYVPMAVASGNLRGICPSCETLMHRRINLMQLEALRAILDISIRQAFPHIGDGQSLSVNCDFINVR